MQQMSLINFLLKYYVEKENKNTKRITKYKYNSLSIYIFKLNYHIK